MKNLSLLIITSCFIIICSCTDIPIQEDENPDNTTSGITTEEYDNLFRVCADDKHEIKLTPPLKIEANYLKNDHTIEIYSIMMLCEQLRLSLGYVLFPSKDAVKAEVDNISIFAEDNAYEWKIGNERYVYRHLTDGYQIRYYGDNSLAGNEMVNLHQDENCNSMQYIQYAIAEEEGYEIGDVVFNYHFQQAGTAKNVYFVNTVDSSDIEYRIRVFEDLSGELSINESGELTKKLKWEADGSGNYEIWKNGNNTESGVWQL